MVLMTALLVTAALFSTVSAQAPETITSAEIYLRLKKLNTLGCVLYVAAHPDDENSRLIAYMAKDRLYRTGYLSMTRGDGGQNLIGNEQGVELGLIRTQEMLAARKVDGAEQFFTRAFDFGYSKSTDEALRTWGKEKVLSDVVWVIRRFQPDVIITRFPEDARAGHGHHSASAVLAHEAYEAAADPNRFPEQFKYGVRPWKATRLLFNSFNFGGNNTTSEDQMKIDVGGYNPILGKSYGELAAESRTNHKSQGAALTPARGQSMEYFTLTEGEPARHDPMEGVETSWRRVEGGGKLEKMIDELVRRFDLSAPAASVPGLVNLYKEMGRLKDGYWKSQKMKEVLGLIEACSGLWLEATTRTGYAVQGDSLTINFVINNRLNAKAAVEEIGVPGFDSAYRQTLDGNRNYALSGTILVSTDKPVTQPYWLEEPMSAGSFNVRDQQEIGNPQGPPSYQARFKLLIEGQEFVFTRPVRYKYTDAVKGEIYQPVTVLPPFTGGFDPGLVLFTHGEEKDFSVNIRKRSAGGGLPPMKLTGMSGVSLKKLVGGTGSHEGGGAEGANGAASGGASVAASGGASRGAGGAASGGASDVVGGAGLYVAKPAAQDTGVYYSYLVYQRNGRRDSAKELKTISYDHIPRIDYFLPSIGKFVAADVKTAGHRIGYIEGAGDKVPEALEEMGFEVVLLGERDINAANLSGFDAIITGVRAYDVHDWLAARHDVLMQYIDGGGELIVQYNRDNLNRQSLKIGPYPFAVSNIRVTDEMAQVNFLTPEHPVLNFPNKITSKDFEGWVQERGIYFAGQADSAYKTVLSMKDPGEQEQKGSLLIADYGRGKFVYTGLVFFRELPAGVPGAYRLMANIIALNHKKAF
jgi:LmbE family N-acetylglucosaminyl deacetylase